jgi:hypothetical protein
MDQPAQKPRPRAVYMTDDEWAEVQAAAARDERPASAWVRLVALREARASAVPPGLAETPAPFERD